MSKLTLECVGWKPLRRNTRPASHRSAWSTCGSPSSTSLCTTRAPTLGGAAIETDHRPRRHRQAHPPTGKIVYTPMFDFDAPAVRSAFSAAAIAAVLAAHPDAFTEPVAV